LLLSKGSMIKPWLLFRAANWEEKDFSCTWAGDQIQRTETL